MSLFTLKHGFLIVSRPEFNKHFADARKWDKAASRAQLAFWTQLLEDEPDVLQLTSLASLISKTTAAALISFGHVIRLQLAEPSPNVLRTYAAFLIDVGSNAALGKQLLRQADSIDNARAHEIAGALAFLLRFILLSFFLPAMFRKV